NEEVIYDDLSIVSGNYQVKENLILDCLEKDPLLELHFNLSKSPIFYKNSFTFSDTVPSMTGNMIYIAPSDFKSEISFEENVEYETFDIHFPLKMLGRYWGENRLLDSFLDKVSKNRSVGLTDNNIKLNSKILCAIQDIRDCRYEGLTRKLYLESKIYEILAFCFESDDAERRQKLSKRDIDCINFAAQVIKDRISNPITIEELAKKTGINETKLKSGFKIVFGTTVFGYLQELRMNKAKHFLFDSDLSVEEISRMCGYMNVSNFSAAFKKHFGFPPSTCKK
ncbi:AraC family transcriptional regulator, partial [Chryseobacterium sp.]|uniref:helix-turn-helix transcriptional regulator n=1 Tax=Chryseobacterium sp. TaxID=1871047 RepID=UPI0025C0B73C